MPAVHVLRLEEYRDRRSARLRLARALHRGDPLRYSVFNHLVEVSELTGADRAAAVWVDEHGTGLIHPYVVVDHLSGRPRRMFSPEPLREAWQLGVPSAHDFPAVPATATPTTFAVALGSDGTRAWFLVADSVMPRPAVGSDGRDRLMFLAGECAAVVLHRDLDVPRDPEVETVSGSRFAGWDILADLEGRESDEVESRRIAQRFVVARLVRMLVDDDLAVSRERTIEQVRRARAELDDDVPAKGEAVLLSRTLTALEAERLDDLATTLVELGDACEAQGHTSGALEIYRCAYDVAAGIGAARPAAEAARLSARLARRRTDWSGARACFERAREVAEAAELHDVAAQVLVGLAGISKETGNLPAARRGLQEALAVAELSGHRDTIALVHHGLLGLEQVAGNLAAGLEHGWVSVALYESDSAKMRCLASLAGALMEYGDREAAEDAWTVVATSCEERYYRVFAHDALAHLAALRRDRQGFRSHADACDALGWRADLGWAKAQVLYYRGLSYAALGERELAEQWLSEAATFAEGHEHHQMAFRADEALRALRAAAPPSSASPPSPPSPAAPHEVRSGLRAMRRELAGSLS